VALLGGILRPLFTNVQTGQTESHRGIGPSQGHTMLDLGDDLFTVGRLHPMLDGSLRNLRLVQEAADPEIAVLLLDVVLGEAVPADPAGDLVPVISAAVAAAAESRRHLAVVASVCGTDEDPQNRAKQVERLEAAGVLIEDSNARAVALAGLIASRAADIPAVFVKAVDSGLAAEPSTTGSAGLETPPSDRGRQLLEAPLRVVNAGLGVFAESLRAQQIEVVDLDWRPPAGGDRAMMDLLERLE
jgi:FdrA protein